jgi:hypothetical protein
VVSSTSRAHLDTFRSYTADLAVLLRHKVCLHSIEPGPTWVAKQRIRPNGRAADKADHHATFTALCELHREIVDAMAWHGCLRTANTNECQRMAEIYPGPIVSRRISSSPASIIRTLAKHREVPTREVRKAIKTTCNGTDVHSTHPARTLTRTHSHAQARARLYARPRYARSGTTCNI